MNAINVISPYKHHGMWVFDDARVGLVQEPFVSTSKARRSPPSWSTNCEVD
jgi:hypothetical protein